MITAAAVGLIAKSAVVSAFSAQRFKSMGALQGYRHATMQYDTFRHQMSSSNDEGVSEVDKLRQQAKRAKLEAEKLEATLTLEKINKLELSLAATPKKGEEVDAKFRENVKLQIENLARKIDPSLVSSLPLGKEMNGDVDSSNIAASPTTTVETNLYKSRGEAAANSKPLILEADLISAIEYYTSLSKPMRQALAGSIGLEEDKASPAIVVLGLYEKANELDASLLQKTYVERLNTISTKNGVEQSLSSMGVFGSTTKANGESDNPFQAMQSEDDRLEAMIESFLPSVTRKEGAEPTKADIDFLKTDVLNKDIFQLSAAPQKVPGAYVLRGQVGPKLRDNGDKLIETLDEKIEKMSPEWHEKFQVCYMSDPTPNFFDNEDDFIGEPVLVVLSRDMKPTTSPLLTSSISAFSLFLTFIFSLAIFSQNDVVMNRITAANAVSDFDLTWFNQLITPLLISIGFTQAIHETAHLIVAKKDNFKITPPTILPLIALPYMSFQQNLKTSPKNFKSLFDFGMVGPAVGMVTSMAFLLVGLQLTLNMDAAALEYAPSVPVQFLKLSSLGGNIADYVLGGGQEGIIIQQDPLTPIKMHPFAIGGFASLMINCLDTIPIPGTDGGRMSQALLGRPGQIAFGGVVFFSLLGYAFLSGHRDIFLTFLLVNSFARKEQEIPCRNEIETAGLGQAATALVMWCVAILTLTPIN